MRKYYKIPKSIAFSEVKVRRCIEKQINIKIDNERIYKEKKNVISRVIARVILIFYCSYIISRKWKIVKIIHSIGIVFSQPIRLGPRHGNRVNTHFDRLENAK